MEDVLPATHGRLLAARYLPRLLLLDGEAVQRGVVFLEPPPGAPPPARKQPPGAGAGAGAAPAEELRLRWRADRGDTVRPWSDGLHTVVQQLHC